MHGAKKVLHAQCQKSVPCTVPKRCCMHGAKRCRMHGAERVSHAWCRKGVACMVPKRVLHPFKGLHLKSDKGVELVDGGSVINGASPSSLVRIT